MQAIVVFENRAHPHHVRQSRVNSWLSIDLSAFTFSKADDHVHHHRCNTRSFHFIAAVVASSSYIFNQLFKSVECRGKCLLGVHDYPPESCRSCVWPVTRAPDHHVSGYRLASTPHRGRDRYPCNEWPFPRSHATAGCLRIILTYIVVTWNSELVSSYTKID